MKDLSYYLNLPYTVILRPDEDGDVVARVEELPGCSAHGKSQREALESLEEAKELWITDCLESGDPIPEPLAEEALPSGKWLQRVPRTVHRKLIDLAKRERVSLNQFVTSVLSEAIGVRKSGQVQETKQEVQGKTLLVWSYQTAPWELSAKNWSIRERPALRLSSRKGLRYMTSEGRTRKSPESMKLGCDYETDAAHWSK